MTHSDEIQEYLENQYGNDAGWHPCPYCSGGTLVTNELESIHDRDCLSLIPTCGHGASHGQHCPIYDAHGNPR